ncbi:hypothetical protein [Actinorugispora endophytica]|uniref:Uncharacterized protein n=1 Tax=Actinorugispora endophytica TaxID=1605990 RepID=A0A4R6VC55_9ACTN|nr:hypothetical protein [Actinorugispora endophytica]TDQ54326.1 hypothetical protein EV190_102160 [Actinorugispora endophytica]
METHPRMQTFVLLAALGGVLPSLLKLSSQISGWQLARTRHLNKKGSRRRRPALRDHCDVVPLLVGGAFHSGLGALAGYVLTVTDQITTPLIAFVAGVSARSIFQQVASVRINLFDTAPAETGEPALVRTPDGLGISPLEPGAAVEDRSVAAEGEELERGR